jgi:PmbA protein
MRRTEIMSVLQTACDISKSCQVDSFEVHILVNQGHVISVRNLAPELLEFNVTQKLSVQIYHEGKTGYAQTSDLSFNSIKNTIESAKKIAKYTERDAFSGIVERKYLALPQGIESLYHPWKNFTVERVLDLAKKCESYGLNHRDISCSDGVSISQYEMLRGFANSYGFIDIYPETKYSINASFITKDKHGMQRDSAYYAGRDIQKLPSVRSIAEEAIEKTIARKNPQLIKTQTLPIILSPSVAKSFIRHLLTALTGARQYNKNTFLHNVLDRSILPSGTNVVEDPMIENAIGSRAYDNEGVNKGINPIIENGVIKRYILDSYSSRQMKMETTGNAGGISNIKIYERQKGRTTKAELIKKMDHGIIVEETMGQGTNLITGDYSQGAMGFYVKYGRIQYPIDNFNIAGNLKTMFASVQGLTTDNMDKNSNVQMGSLLTSDCHISGK